MTTVSAILAVHNGANYLAEAVSSMLGQSRPPDEIIIVDDGSTDNTADIVRSFGDSLVLISQPQSGQGAAFQAGIAAATCSYLAFNDHDDLWIPTKLELQLRALAADPSLDGVFGHAEQFVSPELPDDVAERLRPPVAVLPGEIAQCMLIRTDAFHHIGGFDAADGASAFLGWLARAKRAGFHTAMLPDVVLRRRLHLSNFGRTSARQRDIGHLAALRRHIISGRR